MSLTEIILKYEISKESTKDAVVLCVPEEIKENVDALLVDGYASVKRGKDNVYFIYNIDQLRSRTGLDFNYKH